MLVALRRQRVFWMLLKGRGRMFLIGVLDRRVVGMRDVLQRLLFMRALVIGEIVMMIGRVLFRGRGDGGLDYRRDWRLDTR